MRSNYCRRFGLIYGCTRTVLLFKNYVIKLPSFRSWKYFLIGLLANIHEHQWWLLTKSNRLCPVKFYIPGGFLLVMPRCDTLETFDDWDYFDELPLDKKVENLGMYNGKVVLIDYGS